MARLKLTVSILNWISFYKNLKTLYSSKHSTKVINTKIYNNIVFKNFIFKKLKNKYLQIIEI